MSGATQVFRLAKMGNSEADYEDAFAIRDGRISIADGATESSFARDWAQALVQGFTSERSLPEGADALRRQLAPLQKGWHEKIAWERLPWFAEDKARSGAFAALLAFQFEENVATPSDSREPAISHEPGGANSGRGRWSAMAVGDCCLFQVRGETLKIAFPIERSEQFNSRPVLISSNPANNDLMWDAIARREGEYEPGDLFLFATDALAHWILAQAEAGDRPWQTLCALRSHAEFEALVERLRQYREMRNDDVTLVLYRVPAVVPEPVGALDATVHPLSPNRRRLLRSRGRRRA